MITYPGTTGAVTQGYDGAGRLSRLRERVLPGRIRHWQRWMLWNDWSRAWSWLGQFDARHRSSQSIMTGGAYGVGIGGSIGLNHPPNSANDISCNPDDWEIDFFPGEGEYGGYQQSTDPISVLPWH